MRRKISVEALREELGPARRAFPERETEWMGLAQDEEGVPELELQIGDERTRLLLGLGFMPCADDWKLLNYRTELRGSDGRPAVFVESLERQASRMLPNATVECPSQGSVLFPEAGGSIQCRRVDESGGTSPLTLELTDDEGGFSIELGALDGN